MNHISFVYELEDVFVLIDSAIPCGLILNELISNALRYAFPNGGRGQIRIDLCHLESEQIQIKVSDNGTGLPSGFDAQNDGRMGFQMLFAFVAQLRGTINLETSHGLSCTLKFKDDLYQKRI